MNIICKLFGHKPLTISGWSGGVGYAEVVGSTVDGIGTGHLFISANCPRCGVRYSICNVHIPKIFMSAYLKKTAAAPKPEEQNQLRANIWELPKSGEKG